MTEPEESYIGRKTAAERYQRGERTLERDISQALKLRDEKFLGSLRLRTKDGGVLPGMEVTFEMIDDLKISGQVPTWEIAESLLADRYGLRGEEGNGERPVASHGEGTTPHPETMAGEEHRTQAGKQSGVSRPIPHGGLPPLPRDAVEQAEILKALYQDLQRELQSERQRNDKIFSLIETIPKQQEQTNILLREFQQLLKSGNAVLALPSKSDPPQQRTQVIEAKTIEDVEVDVSAPGKSQLRPKKPARRRTVKSRPKKPARKRASKTAPKPPSFAETYLPSLSRFFGSTPSKKK